MKITKRILASVLSVVLAFSCFAVVPAFAQDLSTLPTYDGVTGVTLVNQELHENFTHDTITYATLANLIEAKVPEKYGSATDNTLQLSGMDTAWLQEKIGTKTNLLKEKLDYQMYSQRNDAQWNRPSGDAYIGLFDNIIMDTVNTSVKYWQNGTVLATSGYPAFVSEGNETKYGAERVAQGGFDMRFKADMGANYVLDNFYLFATIRPDLVPVTYKVYVSESEATLYNAENEVFYWNAYDYMKNYNGVTINGVYKTEYGTAAKQSEGQFLTFGGETKPQGRYLGIIIYDSSYTDNYWSLMEFGALGTKVSSVSKNLTHLDETSATSVSYADKLDRTTIKLDEKYTANIQLSNMIGSALKNKVAGDTNLISEMKIKQFTETAFNTFSETSFNALTDMNYYNHDDNAETVTNGTSWGSTTALTYGYEKNYTSVGDTSILYGASRIAKDRYDALVTAKLQNKTAIKKLVLVGGPNQQVAHCTYAVFVGDNEADLYNPENQVFLFDAYDNYKDGENYKFNGYGKSGTTRGSEAQYLEFTGEALPEGKYVGIKYYDMSTTGDATGYFYDFFVSGTEIVEAKTGLTIADSTTEYKDVRSYAEKLTKLNAEVNDKYTATLQLADLTLDTLPKMFEGETNQLKSGEYQTWADKDTNKWNTSVSIDALTDFGYVGNGTATAFGSNTVLNATGYNKETFAAAGDTAEYKGAARVTNNRYDMLLTFELKGLTAIEDLYMVGHPTPSLSPFLYEIYVGNDKETLYTKENKVFFYDYSAAVASGEGWKFNGSSGSGNRTGDIQYLKFSGETLPTGKYVGFKVYDAADHTYYGACNIYEVGVYGETYGDIETIHNDLIEVVPYNCSLSLIPGKTQQFKVNTYGDAEVTAVKMVKEGAEDVVLTATEGVYTTPVLEEGMKIKVETNVDATTPTNGMWNGIDLSKNSTAYEPYIWDNEVTYNEGLMIYNGGTTRKLLYPIKDVVSVRSYDLQTVYYPGKDYVVTADGELQITEDSSIPVYDTPYPDFYNFEDFENGVYKTNWNTVGGWEKIQWQYQIAVTYTHSETWGNDALYETKPAGQLGNLASFVKKAESGETTNVVFYGDSVGVGCSSTGLVESTLIYNNGAAASTLTRNETYTKASTYGLNANNLPDWVCETWPRAVTNALKDKYGDNITYTNRAIGSTASAFGSTTENLNYLLGNGDTENPCPVPDLLFVHYGLNEMGVNATAHKANIAKIIDYARTLNPNCAVVLVSAFYPPQFTGEAEPKLTTKNIPQFEEAYYELAAEYDNVMVVPINSITGSMNTVKVPMDYTHNLYNHPNDFGARIYTATILAALEETEANLTIEPIADVEYTTEAINPTIVVKNGDVVLKENVNYTVEIKDNIAIGQATITVTGINGTSGTATANFNIVHTQHKYDDCGDTTCEYCTFVRESADHTEKTIPAVDATCTEPGYTAGVKCSVCGAIITAPTEIAASGHKEETIPKVPATCKETGLTEGKKCTVCGVVTVPQQEIGIVPHTEKILPAVPSTCKETGLTEGKECTVCGETLVAQETTEKLPHTEKILPAIPVTCTESGLTEGKKCSVCDEVLVAQDIIPYEGHDEEIIKGYAATCTKEGLTDGRKCKVCGETTVAQATIKVKEHLEDKVRGKAPTCTANGSTDGSKCRYCGKVFVAQKVLPAKGHTIVTIPAKAATYTATGLTAGKKCSVCGVVTLAQKVVAKLPQTSLKKAKFTVKDKTYTGKALTQSFTVKLGSKTLKNKVDYTVSYKNNKNIGKATVTIKGIGAYKDSVSKTFAINPKKVSSLKVKAGKKQLTVSWKKDSKIGGYEIVYATSKNFKSGKKTVKISKASTAKKVISKLKSKKTYYVKVRSFKKVSGKTYYGAYTSVKSVKVK